MTRNIAITVLMIVLGFGMIGFAIYASLSTSEQARERVTFGSVVELGDR